MLAISVFIGLHFFNFHRGKAKAIKFSNFELIQKISTPKKNYPKLILRIFILVLIVFAAAGSVYEYTQTSNNFNFILTIDNSQTMTEDFDAVKKAAINLVNALPQGVRIGLISFSENAQVESGLTSNKNTIISAIEDSQLTTTESRNVGSSIIESVRLLMAEEEKIVRARRTTSLTPQEILVTTAPSVIILTTTQDEIESPTEEAIAIANNNKATVYTVGIKKEASSDTSLRNIAQSTGGKFFSIENKVLLDRAYARISEITEGKIAYDLTDALLIAILVLLLLEWILEYVRFGTIP